MIAGNESAEEIMSKQYDSVLKMIQGTMSRGLVRYFQRRVVRYMLLREKHYMTAACHGEKHADCFDLDGSCACDCHRSLFRVEPGVSKGALMQGFDFEIVCDECKGRGKVLSEEHAAWYRKGYPLHQAPTGPEDVPCRYCNGTGHTVTELGQKLLDFLNRHFELHAEHVDQPDRR